MYFDVIANGSLYGVDMPRVSRVVMEKNRAAIERESARLFREQGLQGVSVAS